MKKLFTLNLLIVLFFSGLPVKGQTKTSYTRLPKVAQLFLAKYFPKTAVVQVSEETTFFIFNKEYKLQLENGTKIVFDDDGDWKELSMKRKSVPRELVPVNIQKHIDKSFPNTFIKEIKKESAGYEVEISNGLELEFTQKGKFIRIDD